MRTSPDQTLYVIGLVALALVVGTCKGDMGTTGPTGAAGPKGDMGTTGPTGAAGPNAAFKTISNTGLVGVSPSGVSNLLRLDITTTTAGFVYASATGYCNVAQATGNIEWAYIIGSSASEDYSFPLPQALFGTGGGPATNLLLFPIDVTRVLPVSAGANSIFLNVKQQIGSPLQSCGATLTALFTASQLP